MKTKAVLTLVAQAAVILAAVAACTTTSSGTTTRVTIGVVERSEPVTLDSNAGKGALVGGTLGLLSAGGKSSSTQARNAIIGAAAGGVIAGASQGSRSATRYTVRTGSSNVTIVSDQTEIRVGDCVAVEESGSTANIRRTAQSACEPAAAPAVAQIQPQLKYEATECADAKQQLVQASNDQIDLAIRKVKILCDD